jgi:hypothetical protein
MIISQIAGCKFQGLTDILFVRIGVIQKEVTAVRVGSYGRHDAPNSKSHAADARLTVLLPRTPHVIRSNIVIRSDLHCAQPARQSWYDPSL